VPSPLASLVASRTDAIEISGFPFAVTPDATTTCVWMWPGWHHYRTTARPAQPALGALDRRSSAGPDAAGELPVPALRGSRECPSRAGIAWAAWHGVRTRVRVHVLPGPSVGVKVDRPGAVVAGVDSARLGRLDQGLGLLHIRRHTAGESPVRERCLVVDAALAVVRRGIHGPHRTAPRQDHRPRLSRWYRSLRLPLGRRRARTFRSSARVRRSTGGDSVDIPPPWDA
jgi:hypothetical protein